MTSTRLCLVNAKRKFGGSPTADSRFDLGYVSVQDTESIYHQVSVSFLAWPLFSELFFILLSSVTPASNKVAN